MLTTKHIFEVQSVLEVQPILEQVDIVIYIHGIETIGVECNYMLLMTSSVYGYLTTLFFYAHGLIVLRELSV